MTQRPFNMVVLALPPSIIQPLDLRYLSDDFHVVAFISGHPEYEAVEAMVIRRDTAYTVRTILTKHDQTQVDHVNDDALFEVATRSGRPTVKRVIDVAIDESGRLPTAEVGFLSYRDEVVLLRIVCASEPDPVRGGLTDPGRHALGSGLPVMVRGASAMAAPSSSVTIAGIDFPIPEKVRAGPHFTGHDGYFTRRHHMAILRLGKREMVVLRRPKAIAVGEQWMYETQEGRLTYEITSKDEQGRISIASSGYQREIVRGTASARGFALTEVVLASDGSADHGMSIQFEPEGAFTIRVDAHKNAVTGSVVRSASTELTLRPAAPSWAISRPLRIRWQEVADALTIETLRAKA